MGAELTPQELTPEQGMQRFTDTRYHGSYLAMGRTPDERYDLIVYGITTKDSSLGKRTLVYNSADQTVKTESYTAISPISLPGPSGIVVSNGSSADLSGLLYPNSPSRMAEYFLSIVRQPLDAAQHEPEIWSYPLVSGEGRMIHTYNDDIPKGAHPSTRVPPFVGNPYRVRIGENISDTFFNFWYKIDPAKREDQVVYAIERATGRLRVTVSKDFHFQTLH